MTDANYQQQQVGAGYSPNPYNNNMNNNYNANPNANYYQPNPYNNNVPHSPLRCLHRLKPSPQVRLSTMLTWTRELHPVQFADRMQAPLLYVRLVLSNGYGVSFYSWSFGRSAAFLSALTHVVILNTIARVAMASRPITMLHAAHDRNLIVYP